MYKEKIVRIDVLKMNIFIIVTDNISEYIREKNIERYFLKYPEEDLETNVGAITSSTDRFNHYVLMPPEVTWESIAHESCHLVGRMFQTLGQNADYDNDELFAYHVGFLNELIIKFVQEVYYDFPIQSTEEDNGFIYLSNCVNIERFKEIIFNNRPLVIYGPNESPIINLRYNNGSIYFRVNGCKEENFMSTTLSKIHEYLRQNYIFESLYFEPEKCSKHTEFKNEDIYKDFQQTLEYLEQMNIGVENITIKNFVPIMIKKYFNK